MQFGHFMKMSTKKEKQYGLLIRKKPQPQLARKSVFDDSDDDEPESKKVEKLIVKESMKNQVKRQTQIEIKKALQEDPTVYDYDNIYDDIQKKKEVVKAAAIPKERQPRYIQSLLKSAEQRKKDNERRIERQIQKERQEEGETFADKEAFVTTAYKNKLQEMQEEEEREQRERHLEEMMDVTKQKDLSGFYRHFLNQTTGEEEIPEFGKRFSSSTKNVPEIKKEKMSPKHGEERAEVATSSDNDDNNRSKAKEAVTKQRLPKTLVETPGESVVATASGAKSRIEEARLNADSDSSVQSGNSGHSLKRVSSSEKVSSKRKDSFHQQKRKRLDSDVDSDLSSSSSTESERTENSNEKKSRSRQKITVPALVNTTEAGDSKELKSKHKTAKSSEDSQLSPKKEEMLNSDVRDAEDSVKSKMKIFEKRTVGNVFLEAKARYLARRETRENARRIFSSA